jgi:hypothetical protein
LGLWFISKTKPKPVASSKSKRSTTEAKSKKLSKAEVLAAKALALRPWYQKKRFAFPAIGALAFVVFAISLGLLLPAQDSNNSASDRESSSETARGDGSGEGEAGKETQATAPAPAPPAPQPQVIIVKVQEPEPAGRTPPAEQAAPSETESQQWAREDARYYWSQSWYSRSGLINYLVDLGYSYADAEYGTDSLGVDWYSESSGMANWYLSGIYLSRSGLIGQLEWEGFSTAEAIYGTDSTGADWYLQAWGLAVELIAGGYTEQGAFDYLISEYFTVDEAYFGSYYAANP